jgi:hypothetical protein
LPSQSPFKLTFLGVKKETKEKFIKIILFLYIIEQNQNTSKAKQKNTPEKRG